MRTTLFATLLFAVVFMTGSCQSQTQNTDAGATTTAEKKPAPVEKIMKNVDPREFEYQIQNTPDAVVLDVRTEGEFNAGHIDGAINIDVENENFNDKIKSLDANKTYLVYCQAGVRSLKACSMMQLAGFPKIINLSDGYASWEEYHNK